MTRYVMPNANLIAARSDLPIHTPVQAYSLNIRTLNQHFIMVPPPLSTPLTTLLGIKHPIMLAGMDQVAGPALAAAVW